MFMKTGMRNHQGFTLVEMMVVLIIITVLTAMLVPNMTDMFRRNKLATGTNEFLSDMATARSEAIRISSPVTIAAKGASFSEGWCILHGNGSNCGGSGTTIVRETKGITGVALNGDSTSITFDRLGRASVAGNSNNGRLWTIIATVRVQEDKCTAGEVGRARQVQVSIAGRAAVTSANCQ